MRCYNCQELKKGRAVVAEDGAEFCSEQCFLDFFRRVHDIDLEVIAEKIRLQELFDWRGPGYPIKTRKAS